MLAYNTAVKTITNKVYKLYTIISPSGKKYVGVTGRTIEERWKGHVDTAKSGAQLPISEAIRKYGKEAFTIEEKERSSDKDEISLLEKKYIIDLNTLSPNGYNICEGGLYEVNWTNELRKKASEKATVGNIKRYQDINQIELSRKNALDQWKDPEFRNKMQIGRNRKNSNLEYKQLSSERFTKLWQQEEFVNKQLESRLRSRIVNNTPVEKYYILGQEIFVKRDDLSAKPPLPPFSKIRGLAEHLINLKQSGITTVGYTETSISMAGIGVSYIANKLKMKSVIFNPIYKKTPIELEFHRTQWKRFGAEIVDLKAGMAKVNFNIGKNILKKDYTNSVMLPLGLPLLETIRATREEAHLSSNNPWGSIVVNIGSGTICSGLLSVFGETISIYGIMGRTGDVIKKRMKIINQSQVLSFNIHDFHVIDPGYEYTDSVEIEVPFPCNKYYDAKAYKWLTENIQKLKGPILFWNIGSNTPTNI